jgi:RNA 3'-terminal phosphate cyclase (ATP)
MYTLSIRASVTTGGLICDTVFRSIGLLIQVALPCILFSNGITTLKLRGGTNADMAPQIDYTTEVC